MSESFYDLYCQEVQKNEKLTQEIKQLKKSNLSLVENRLKYMENNHDKIIEAKVTKKVNKITVDLQIKLNNKIRLN